MVKYTITKGQWKKISDAGESGTAWLKSANGFSPILIFSHTDSTQTPSDDIPLASAVDLDNDAGFIYKNFKETPTPVLENEGGNDIWYCTVANGATGATCEIIADFS